MPRASSHIIENRKWELVLGFALALFGMYLLWDAYDNRGKKMMWPLSGLAPW